MDFNRFEVLLDAAVLVFGSNKNENDQSVSSTKEHQSDENVEQIYATPSVGCYEEVRSSTLPLIVNIESEKSIVTSSPQIRDSMDTSLDLSFSNVCASTPKNSRIRQCSKFVLDAKVMDLTTDAHTHATSNTPSTSEEVSSVQSNFRIRKNSIGALDLRIPSKSFADRHSSSGRLRAEDPKNVDQPRHYSSINNTSFNASGEHLAIMKSRTSHHPRHSFSTNNSSSQCSSSSCVGNQSYHKHCDRARTEHMKTVEHRKNGQRVGKSKTTEKQINHSNRSSTSCCSRHKCYKQNSDHPRTEHEQKTCDRQRHSSSWSKCSSDQSFTEHHRGNRQGIGNSKIIGNPRSSSASFPKHQSNDKCSDNPRSKHTNSCYRPMHSSSFKNISIDQSFVEHHSRKRQRAENSTTTEDSDRSSASYCMGNSKAVNNPRNPTDRSSASFSKHHTNDKSFDQSRAKHLNSCDHPRHSSTISIDQSSVERHSSKRQRTGNSRTTDVPRNHSDRSSTSCCTGNQYHNHIFDPPRTEQLKTCDRLRHSSSLSNDSFEQRFAEHRLNHGQGSANSKSTDSPRNPSDSSSASSCAGHQSNEKMSDHPQKNLKTCDHPENSSASLFDQSFAENHPNNLHETVNSRTTDNQKIPSSMKCSSDRRLSSSGAANQSTDKSRERPRNNNLKTTNQLMHASSVNSSTESHQSLSSAHGSAAHKDHVPAAAVSQPTGKAGKDEDSDDDSEGDLDDEAREVVIGDVSIISDFIIEEYFEKYKNRTLVSDDEDGGNRENDSHFMQMTSSNSRNDSITRMRQPLVPKSVNVPEDLGFEELDNDREGKKDKKLNTRVASRMAKIRGDQYTRSNGTIVPARSVKGLLGCSCSRLKCYESYSHKFRVQMLKNLLKLTISGQNQFLSSHIAIKTTTRTYVINSRRSLTRTYYMPGVNGRVRVCKEMFMNTFDIKDKKLRVLAQKQLAGLGIAADDLRATKTNQRLISNDQIIYIESHIRSFPAYTSHYSREKTKKLYLSSDLTVAKMYQLYAKKCATEQLVPVHYNTYRIMFRKQNLSFRKPKTDTCGECDKFAIRLKLTESDEGEKIILAERDLHHAKAQRAYSAKKADMQEAKKNPKVRTVSFDLQKCLPTPDLPCGATYYSRQLYTLNFTVFASHRGKILIVCYLWDESIARRGSQEMASCLWQDLEKMDIEVEVLNFYSDRCSGQNLNITMCMMFLLFVEKCRAAGREIIINHTFMTSGHSHMEVDSAHACIERAKKNRTTNIETPRDWAVFISAIQKKVPFVVNEMTQPQFLAFKQLEKYFKRPKTNTNGDKIKFKSVTVFQYRSSDPGSIFYKYELNDEDFLCFQMSDGSPTPIDNPPPITDEPIPLSVEKLADLRKLMDFVINKPYYETLLKQLVPKKRGRKAKCEVEDHFEADLDRSDNDSE